ncbi:MAG: pyridoxal 5'-phosphate synthase glutaminase subunit PdxT [Candidatus Marinimicrobia bacterium]|nr:pyridoxal 5'-phosphate synthase glutaminase subunit PdxT [Candidatus Neomarinimicrobiota bacterium]MDP7120826.1 pyridoxal 5'-phosphate synthase glutaminase subunit PdxT [Candidatus Neomarinimicrobiota bacterium]MDP7483909.1 pyridoxal 5'-phosphate synthase glutaminase subunit PdxT [Candidatus Neomarinimicrobiota bacterium]MDP7527847.1 pyridoxal 5'-phosphate synthase glutaminase subunit PdxT [Candidatus Neomarinimicrobiota bacterium]MDP7716091.1 pyridoxal 5'-phosphate synthase glutaminase subu
MKRIGVLGLQGAYAKHLAILQQLDVQAVDVRKAEDLEKCHGLIIPGGESTTMTKLINEIDMHDALLKFSVDRPVFGTCAGMILMATKVDDDRVETLNLLDIEVERNAYGRQIDSFIDELDITTNGQAFSMRGVFIRAPRIKNMGDEVEVLASVNGEPVLVQQGHHMAAAFHPELTGETRIHNYFSTLKGEMSLA